MQLIARIQHCPIHIIPGLFAAMGMHGANIRSGDMVLQQLAYVKVRLCMIALGELQSSWPVSGWIFLLFTKLVRRIRDRDDVSRREGTTRPSSGKPTNDTAPSATQAGGSVDINDSQGGVLSGSSARSNPHQSVYDLSHLHGFQANTGPGFGSWEALQAQNLSMPPNLSTDWSGVLDEDLRLVPGFDFMLGISPIEDSTRYSNTPNML